MAAPLLAAGGPAAPAAPALALAAPAAPAGSARFLADPNSQNCASSAPLPVSAWLGLCTPLGEDSRGRGFTVQLTACSPGGSVSGVAYLDDFEAGKAGACTSAGQSFTATPAGECVKLFNRASLRLLGAPTCAPAAPGSVFILESYKPSSSSQCNSNIFSTHRALALGACVAGGFVTSSDVPVNVSVALLASGRAARVSQFDPAAEGCAGSPSAALAPLPDLPLPGPSGPGECNRTGGPSPPPSYRLLAPVVIPSASASRSASPSPTFSFGASPSASPTASPSATPTVGGGGGGGGGGAAAALALPVPVIVAMGVGLPLALLLLAAAACALRRLCSSRSITWSKDAETVIVQSPMRPSIYRPTVKAPSDAAAALGSSARRSAWGGVGAGVPV